MKITMKQTLKTLSVSTALSLPLLLTSCASTTNTGTVGVERKQLLLVSQQEVLQKSAQAYQELLAEARKDKVLNRDKALLRRLRGISNRLTPHINVYRNDAASWNWELNTIKSEKVNAFVLAGGKIMFYSGIVTELGLTDAEIAAIMGHEMAHALREHTRERMSSSQLTQLGIGIAAAGFGLSQGETQLAGIVGELGINRPHSRVQESEADVMGLELMARAGYNPNASISLWKKMQKHKGSSMPQFLSTHPSSSNRIATLDSLIPTVMPLYKGKGIAKAAAPKSRPADKKVSFKKYQP